MAVLLGIDTGGTYTDAVLYDQAEGVIASAKSLTTRHDLSLGVASAVSAVLSDRADVVAQDIALVSLSTTLATNAVVEGHTSPVCLILIGYEESALDRAELRSAVGTDPVAFVAGGHHPSGEPQAALDMAAVEEVIVEQKERVAAFAVAGYFAVRNPAHEKAVREAIWRLCDRPVTCAHELSSNLDAPRRALTALLNARLIPLIHKLILAVRGMLSGQGIAAPLMVVKGDGSLVSADWALERPVETILSGPAASVVGARDLAGEGDVVVVDMGGTTSDIAWLAGGRPVLNRDGARVGGWRTMVEAIAVTTVGLGGDSEVHWDQDRRLRLGPRRLMPISLLAMEHPAVQSILESQLAAPSPRDHDGRFGLRLAMPDMAPNSLSRLEHEIWQALEEGPLPLSRLIESPAMRRPLYRLVDRGLVMVAGFTPSDACHVLGRLAGWSEEAARLGACVMARLAAANGAWRLGWEFGDEREFCRLVVGRVVVQSAQALVSAGLSEDRFDAADQRSLAALVEKSLGADNGQDDGLVGVDFRLKRPLVAIGAPVGSYYPAVAEALGTALVIPPHAEVTNAVGAVASGVIQRASVLITQPEPGRYRVHGDLGPKDHASLETAEQEAALEARQRAEEMARAVGAKTIETVVDHQTSAAVVDGKEVFLEGRIVAQAVGRPRLAREP